MIKIRLEREMLYYNFENTKISHKIKFTKICTYSLLVQNDALSNFRLR